MAATTYSSVAPSRRDSFVQLVRAEWTKFASVRRWVLGMVAAAGLPFLVAVLSMSASSSEQVGADGPSVDGGSGGDNLATVRDELHFVYQPLSGDGSVTARVATQEDSHEWAKAGVMIKESTEHGSPYAALMVTPDHGVRLQANYGDDEAGSEATAPRWLRLTRSGSTITGYESADGDDWTEVGTVELSALPDTVQVGMFVSSPNAREIERQFGGESIEEHPTIGTATFDNVRVRAESGQPQPADSWSDLDRSLPLEDSISTEVDGTFTISGSGDVGPLEFDVDRTKMSLEGVFVGLMAVVAVSVLFVTSEYKRGMIRTTFTAQPRRGQVLAAKALVIGCVTFVAGLVFSFAAFLLTQPMQDGHGFGPRPSLSDGSVLRAVVGTAALLAVVAVFSVGVGVVLRRSAAAIALVIVLLVAPEIVGGGLPLSAAKWLTRLTPSAGFAIQQTVDLYDTAINPWAGFAVLCAYAAVALGLAHRQLRRRDA